MPLSSKSNESSGCSISADGPAGQNPPSCCQFSSPDCTSAGSLLLLQVHFRTSPAAPRGKLPAGRLVLLLLLLLLLLKGGCAGVLLLLPLALPGERGPVATGHTSASHTGHGLRAGFGPGSTGIGLSMLWLLQLDAPLEPGKLHPVFPSVPSAVLPAEDPVQGWMFTRLLLASRGSLAAANTYCLRVT